MAIVQLADTDREIPDQEIRDQEIREQEVRQAIAAALASVRRLPAQTAIDALSRIRSLVDGLEAEILAGRVDLGATERALTTMLTRDGTTGRRVARDRARRARGLHRLPEIAAKLRRGSLSTGQADVLVRAAERISPDAVRTDPALADRVAGSDPDQGRRIADDWVRDRLDNDRLETEHRRQRRKRYGRMYRTDDGMLALEARFDAVTGAQVKANLEGVADRLYRRDGGRDLPADRHPRRPEQRLADAIASLMIGTAAVQTDADRGPTASASAEDPNPTITSGAAGSGPRRNRVHVVARLDKILGNDDTPADLVGTGPLPDSVLDRLACGADFIGTIFGGSGQVLWQGRSHRTVTDAQWDALVARDHGCVLCSTGLHACEAHHLLPWNAPAPGRTDIENLALLCANCHHTIHDQQRTLLRDPDTTQWTTRPARPPEIPPPRPSGSGP